MRSLAELIGQILSRTGLARLRLSSIEPMDWDPEMIGLMRDFGGSRLPAIAPAAAVRL